jgi:hypothetical protein
MRTVQTGPKLLLFCKSTCSGTWNTCTHDDSTQMSQSMLLRIGNMRTDEFRGNRSHGAAGLQLVQMNHTWSVRYNCLKSLHLADQLIVDFGSSAKMVSRFGFNSFNTIHVLHTISTFLETAARCINQTALMRLFKLQAPFRTTVCTPQKWPVETMYDNLIEKA